MLLVVSNSIKSDRYLVLNRRILRIWEILGLEL